MIACICGFEALTEDDLTAHFIECHRLSYGLETICSRESSDDRDSDSIRPAA